MDDDVSGPRPDLETQETSSPMNHGILESDFDKEKEFEVSGTRAKETYSEGDDSATPLVKHNETLPTVPL